MDAVTAGLLGVVIGFAGNWLRDWTQHRWGRSESRRAERLEAYANFIAVAQEWSFAAKMHQDNDDVRRRYMIARGKVMLVGSPAMQEVLFETAQGLTDGFADRDTRVSALIDVVAEVLVVAEREMKGVPRTTARTRVAAWLTRTGP